MMTVRSVMCQVPCVKSELYVTLDTWHLTLITHHSGLSTL